MAQDPLTAAAAGEEVVPPSKYRALEEQVREVNGLLGKKVMENEVPREAVSRAAGEKNCFCARSRCRGMDGERGRRGDRLLTAAAAFTFLNPHVYLDTLLLMRAAGAAQATDLRPILVGGAITASLNWFAAIGFGARLLRPIFAQPAAWRVLDAIVDVVMLRLASSLIVPAAPAMHRAIRRR